MPSHAHCNKPSIFGLPSRFAALFAYVLLGVSGLVVLTFERGNGFVRFHAAQSVCLFCAGLGLTAFVVFMKLSMPVYDVLVVNAIATFYLVGMCSLIVVWAWAALKAYDGVWYRVPILGELAQDLADWTARER